MIDATGQFATARQLHQALGLQDGRVLVCGGFGAERLDAQGAPVAEMLASAYVFNPQTNAFSAVSVMSENGACPIAGQGPGARAPCVKGLRP